MFVRALSIICSLAIAGVALAQAPPPAETVDSLLAMPPAPGVEALLISHANDVRVVQRWMGLLGDPNADLRLSAVRALGATNVKSAAPALVKALESEQDPAVVSELLRAIAVVAPGEEVVAIYAHMHRVNRETVAQILEIVAATRPAQVATHIRTERFLRADAETVSAAYARIARTQPAIAGTIEIAPEVTGDATVLTGILRGAAIAKRTLPAAVINAGLRHGYPVRAATLAYVAAAHGQPKAARAALGSVNLPTATDPTRAEERWMRALEQRWLTGSDGGRLASVIDALPDEPWIHPTSIAVLGVLRSDERAAYARRFSLPDRMARALRDEKLAESMRAGTPAQAPVRTMTLLSGMPGVMLADVVRLTGCAPGEGDEQFAALRYRPDGRPASVGLARETWSPGCERAAHAAVAMSYGPPPLTSADQTTALVRLDAEFVACLSARTAHRPASDPDAGRRDDLTPPTKLRNAPPAYPADALNSRTQGVVLVEAHIEPSGCIGFARVVWAVHPSLDAAAMRAVTRWQYTPTMLRGVPVPVVMTTTVNFSLQ